MPANKISMYRVGIMLLIIAAISAAQGSPLSNGPPRAGQNSTAGAKYLVSTNKPPTVSKPFETILVQGGHLHKLGLDEHYNDDHDSNLSYSVQNVGDNWIYVVESDLCVLIPSERAYNLTRFSLIAEDSEGLTVTTILEVSATIHLANPYFLWPFYFKFTFPTFPNWKEIMYENMTQGDYASFILARAQLSKNRRHVSVRYLNKSLGGHKDCPLGNIVQVANAYRKIYTDFQYKLFPQSSCKNNSLNNSAPVIKNNFTLPNVSQGELFQFKIPDDFCYDPEEGYIFTDFIWKDMSQAILKHNWLRFSSSKRALSGIYVENRTEAMADFSNRLIRGGKYKLICQDSFGKKTSHLLKTWIAMEQDKFGVEFKLQFSAYSRHPLRDFFDRLAIVFNSSPSQIKVNSYSINLSSNNRSYDVHVVWYNKSNPGIHEAIQLRSILFSEKGRVRREVEDLFNPDFNIVGFVPTVKTIAQPTTVKPVKLTPEEWPPLIVKQPPVREILFEETMRNCDSGMQVTIDCEADGKPSPTYSWVKDGKNLLLDPFQGRIYQKSGRGTLVITAPTDYDVGTYECYATNKWGVASSIPIVVRKMELSSFKGNETMSVTADEGQPVKLSCGSHRTSSRIRANWVQQNSRGEFRGMDSSRIIIDPEGHLWFFKVKQEDQSQDFFYVCFFSSLLQNEYKVGNRVFLKVVAKNVSTSLGNRSPVPLYTTSNHTVALKGQNVEMCCIFAGSPQPKINWTRRGAQLPVDRTRFENNETTLIILNVDFSDNGTYSCEAANGVGAAMHHSVHLFVFVPPRFTEEPTIQVAWEGETAVLRCKAEGRPLPEIQWIHNGAPLREAPDNPRRKLLEDDTILIENLTKADTGNYGCNATNSFSYVYKEVYVNVIVEDTEGPYTAVSQTSIAISSVAFVCLAAATVLIVVLWKKHNRLIKVIRNLTKDEVEEFYTGKNSKEDLGNGVPVESLPFVEHKKILSEDLDIESTVLGEGEFGIVHKGRLRDEWVAVKSSKSAADIEYFKAFLQEIKLMAYIDEHENIVRFYGAVVDRIQERECSAVMELSPLGNLKDYLRIHAKEYLGTSSENPNSTPQVLTQEVLLSFCKQIASGMEFLALKNVIHGDLAARNILVYENNVVKVTDFGLSRKLYGCANYTKKKQIPLPWRWMAIESLRFFEFSIQSDVWSFGVTAWEIFSLSQVPFAGLQWTANLADKFESGLRLSKPKHCNPIVYDWMMRCWATLPDMRPTFTECKAFFSSPCRRDNIYSPIDRNILKSDLIII